MHFPNEIGSPSNQETEDGNATTSEERNVTATEEEPLLINNHPEASSKMTGGYAALFNFLKGCIGSGILALPSAFKYGGLYTSIVLLVSCSILSTYLMHVLLRTTEAVIVKNNLDRTKIDYAEAVFYIFKFGPERLRIYKGKAKHTVNVFLIVTQIGVCCIYILFAAQNIKYFIQITWPGTYANLYLIGFIVTCFVILLNLKVTMRIFAIPSIIAMIATFTGLGLIFIYLFTTGLKDPSSLSKDRSFGDVLVALGVFIYTFEGVSLTLPICNHMRHPDEFVATFGTLNTTAVIVTCLCLLQGAFGYLCFGDGILGSITYNIPNEPRIYMAIKPLFVFSIGISYMLQFYIPAIIFGRLMLKIPCHRDATDKRQSINRKILRVCLILLTYAGAMLVPHLDLMVALLGAFASSALSLLIPPAIEVIHLWPQRDHIPRFYLVVVTKHAILFTVGLTAAACAGSATIVQIIHGGGDGVQ